MSVSSDHESYLLSLQDETPKIHVAMKNLIAVVLGQSITASDTDLLAGIMIYTPNQALLCAKMVMKAIQSFKLLEYLSYASQHPQGEEQTGIARLEELNKYKALIFLRDRVLSSHQSINKFFGKSYFLWSQQWHDIARQVIDADAPNCISRDHIHHFLALFENSLGSDDIIWSEDFQEVLYNRSQERKQIISDRQSRVEELDVDESSSA